MDRRQLENRIPCTCGHWESRHNPNSAGTISCFECVDWIKYKQDIEFAHPYKADNLGYLEQSYDELHPVVYFLKFNDFEANYVLGIFKTQEEAAKWREYFVKHPDNEYCSSMKYRAQHDQEDYEYCLEIEKREIGTLHPEIKIDNLKYLEMKYDETNKNV